MNRVPYPTWASRQNRCRGLWLFVDPLLEVRSAVWAICVVKDEAQSGLAVAADRPDGSFAGAAGRQNTCRVPQATGPIQAMYHRPRSTPGRRESHPVLGIRGGSWRPAASPRGVSLRGVSLVGESGSILSARSNSRFTSPREVAASV